MKKLYILLSGLLMLLSYSCIKSTGNEYKPDLPTPAVQGYAATYTIFTHRDTLKINPTVANESQYDFYWTAYSNNFNVFAVTVPKPDTLSKSKNLSYVVLLDPGAYTLIFNIRNKQTGVTQMLTSALAVSTLTMNGWYLLKDNNNTTDLDFISSTGRIDNVLNFYNGKSLTGKAIKSLYCGSFKTSLNSKDLFDVLFVLTDQDAAICRIDNGKIVMDYDNMFFTRPTVKNLQNVLQPQQDGFIHLINNGQVYSMNKGALFSSPPVSTYNISSIAGVAYDDVCFDENSKTMIFVDGTNYLPVGANGTALKNMNADLIWLGSYPGARGVALALFRQADGSGTLFKLSVGPAVGGSGTLITGSDPVPATHGLMSADVIGGNYDSDYIYYAKANKIYMTDFASLPETLQITLPAGETVTCIQHIKFPQPASASVVSTVNYLAIASYNNGNYKVWLEPISATGTIQALPQPNFTGIGRVTGVNYVENGVGSRTF